MSKFWAEPSISPELSQLYTSKLLSFKGEILISGNTLHSICMMLRNASTEEQNLCKSCEHTTAQGWGEPVVDSYHKNDETELRVLPPGHER